jgi:peptidase E
MDEIKSLDGMMTIVFLPDASTVKSIKFFKSRTEKDKIVTKHIF